MRKFLPRSKTAKEFLVCTLKLITLDVIGFLEYSCCNRGCMADIMRAAEHVKERYELMHAATASPVDEDNTPEINKSRVILDMGASISIGDSYRERLTEYVKAKFLGK